MRSNKHERKKEKPELSWQVGKYNRTQQYNFHLPYGFLLLCRLWEVEPETVLVDFMDNLSFGSWKRKGRDEAKTSLADYAIRMRYGQTFYTTTDIRNMFTQLDALGMLFPHYGDSKLVEAFVAFRDRHYTAWFNQWFTAAQRQLHNTKQPADV